MEPFDPLTLAGLTIVCVMFGVFVMAPLVQARRSVIATAALAAFIGLVLLASTYRS